MEDPRPNAEPLCPLNNEEGHMRCPNRSCRELEFFDCAIYHLAEESFDNCKYRTEKTNGCEKYGKTCDYCGVRFMSPEASMGRRTVLTKLRKEKAEKKQAEEQAERETHRLNRQYFPSLFGD